MKAKLDKYWCVTCLQKKKQQLFELEMKLKQRMVFLYIVARSKLRIESIIEVYYCRNSIRFYFTSYTT